MHSSDLVIGVSAPMASSRSRVEDILGADSYDFVSVDSQHSPFNEERLVEFCLMAQDIGIPVHFRIKHTRLTFQVGNYLDLGPTAIEVPQTETEETAQEAVDYFYYRQFGRRSWGGAARVGVAEHPDRLEYAAWWNDYGVLWLQVESLQAISNIPRLVRPGVDCISWGPADLSFDREANPKHPLAVSDDACVQHAVKLLEGTDAELLVRSYDWKLRQKYQDMGVTNLLESPKA
jgi:2-keto-3-deoxy-L-rhamnonate aldolase RhmA